MNYNPIDSVLLTADYAESHLARIGDKSFIFTGCKRCFVMYQEKIGYFVALGDPVGPSLLWSEAIANFIKFCNCNQKKPVFYKIERAVSILKKRKYSVEKIGEDGVIDLTIHHFSFV